MEEQDAVTKPAEETVESESAPDKESPAGDDKPTDASKEPSADTSVEPKKVSGSVPYDRFAEVNTKAKTLEEENAWLKSQMAPPQSEPTGDKAPELDPESAQAVDLRVERKLEERLAKEWEQKHADDLKNRLIASRVRDIIAEGNARREYVDRDNALIQAKKELEEQTMPKVKQAKEESFKEGEELSKQKQVYSAVGENKASPKVDPEKLSAEEYAKYHGLEYSE